MVKCHGYKRDGFEKVYVVQMNSLNWIAGGILAGSCIPYSRKISRLKQEKLLRE